MIRSARVAPTRFSTFSRFRDPVAATFEPRSNSIIHAVHSIVAVPEVNILSEWPPLPTTSIIPRLGNKGYSLRGLGNRDSPRKRHRHAPRTILLVNANFHPAILRTYIPKRICGGTRRAKYHHSTLSGVRQRQRSG